MIGELIDHYRVVELIGRGAMGVVYKALDVHLDRSVAIKVMSAEARGDPDFIERFRQEARLQAALNHPNVALLFDYFVHDGAPVAVMEFIDGESLEQLILRRGAVPAGEAIPIFKQALRGVAAAHRAGIIHRDLKPSNLMVTRDNIVKVMDFGIAKRQGVTGATKASTSIGSPLYMAPEQILGRAVDCRTDVYALGITLYELLSGYRPFNSRGKAEYLVLNAHVNDVPEPPTVYRYGIPQPIVDAVMRALAKDPGERFQSAEDFMTALPDAPSAPAPSAPAPSAPAPSAPVPSATAPQADPSATVVLEYSPTMSVDAVAARGPGGTVVIAPAANGNPASPRVPSGTMAFDYAPTKRRDPHGSTVFEYSAGTVGQKLHPPDSAHSTSSTARPAATVKNVASGPSVAARPGNTSAPSAHRSRGVRVHRPAVAAVLVAALALGALGRHPEWLHATRWLHATPRNDSAADGGPRVTPEQAPTVATTPSSREPAEPPRESVAAPPADAAAAAAVPATVTTPATSAPARHDLSGTWRGEYVDASGKQLVRVVNLSISLVHDDGGIEGTLQYEGASGDGECQLHPRGSSYLAGARRLQLSPEGCSAHYPKELGVPLDFDGVSPRADILRDGRIEAPTGQVIRVKLKRVGPAPKATD
jgi:serine/threonine protein kinase